MSTTPRTDEAIRKYRFLGSGPLELEGRFADFARALETELACEKENRNLLIEKGAKLETELAAAKEAYDRVMAIHGTVLEDLAAEREKEETK